MVYRHTCAHAHSRSRAQPSGMQHCRAGFLGWPQVKHMRASYGCNVVFTLMNSFSTSADTREFLAKQHSDLLTEPYIELMQVGDGKWGVCMAAILPTKCGRMLCV